MGVEVGVQDLIRSYVKLRNNAVKAADSAGRLLQFYSVECGLKAAILGKSGASTRGTRDLPEDLRNHDLRKFVKTLNLAPSATAQLTDCRRRHDPRQTVEPKRWHEAWRYGASLNAEDEKTADAILSELSEWSRNVHGK